MPKYSKGDVVRCMCRDMSDHFPGNGTIRFVGSKYYHVDRDDGIKGGAKTGAWLVDLREGDHYFEKVSTKKIKTTRMSVLKRWLNPELALIEKHFLTAEGNLDLTNEAVQSALLNVIHDELVKAAKEIEGTEGKAKK